MAEDPEELRREIEQTRRNLGRDVDALTEKVSPSRVVGRRVDQARGGVHRLKDKVMGSSESVAGSAGNAMSSVREAGGQVGDAVSSAPDLARARTRGTPLAAGVIAFATGWAVAAALPVSTRERELAQTGKDKAIDAAEPVKEEVAQVAQEVKENLQQPAQEAVEHVKQSATQAASEVADETKSGAQQVTHEANGSAENVRQSGSAG